MVLEQILPQPAVCIVLEKDIAEGFKYDAKVWEIECVCMCVREREKERERSRDITKG